MKIRLSVILYFDVIGRIYPVRPLPEGEASMKAFSSILVPD
jgi:hypothetical protein